MSIPAQCTRCGFQFISQMFSFSGGTVNISNCSVSCPRCGGEAPLQDGSYTFVGRMIAAFSAPGTTRERVEAFRDIASAVTSGAATEAEAEERIAELGPTLANLWVWLNANGQALSVVIAAITLFLMMYYQNSSDEDAAKLQASTEKQTQVEMQIVAELQKQNASAAAPVSPPRPTQRMQPPFPPRTQVLATQPNRRERRAAKARDRRAR